MKINTSKTNGNYNTEGTQRSNIIKQTEVVNELKYLKVSITIYKKLKISTQKSGINITAHFNSWL